MFRLNFFLCSRSNCRAFRFRFRFFFTTNIHSFGTEIFFTRLTVEEKKKHSARQNHSYMFEMRLEQICHNWPIRKAAIQPNCVAGMIQLNFLSKWKMRFVCLRLSCIWYFHISVGSKSSLEWPRNRIGYTHGASQMEKLCRAVCFIWLLKQWQWVILSISLINLSILFRVWMFIWGIGLNVKTNGFEMNKIGIFFTRLWSINNKLAHTPS